MSLYMGAISIEQSETSGKAYYSDLPVAEYIAIYWNQDYILFVWCFNGNINYSH